MSRTETHLVNQNDQKLKGVIFAVVGAIFGVLAVYSPKCYLPTPGCDRYG